MERRTTRPGSPFDRTYEGLKRLPRRLHLGDEGTFDRTYEGLKLQDVHPPGQGGDVLLTVPMRV